MIRDLFMCIYLLVGILPLLWSVIHNLHHTPLQLYILCTKDIVIYQGQGQPATLPECKKVKVIPKGQKFISDIAFLEKVVWLFAESILVVWYV